MNKKSFIQLAIITGCVLNISIAKNQEYLETKNENIAKIVVSATKSPKFYKHTPLPATVISEEEIRKSGEANLGSLLRNRTDVSFVENSHGMSIEMQGFRGGNGRVPRVTLLIDGNPVGLDSIPDFNYLNLNNVERIEIIKGASSVLYGSSAMAGVINIITKEPSRGNNNRISGLLGSYGRRDLSWSNSFRSKYFKYQLNIQNQVFDGFDTDQNTLGTDPFKYDRWALNTMLGFNPMDNLDVEIRGNLRFGEKSYYSGTTTANLINNIYNDEAKNVQILSRYNLDNKSDLGLVANFVDNFSKRKDFNQATSVESGYAQTKEAVSGYQIEYRLFDDSFALITGAEFRNDQLNSDSVNVNKSKQSAGAFINYEHSLSNEIELSIGTRYDKHSGWDGIFNSRAGMVYKQSDQLVWKISAGQSFRAPRLTELYSDWMMGPWNFYGNPNLLPEKSFGINAGMDWDISNENEFAINIFHHKVSDMIDSYTVSAVPPRKMSYRNLNSAKMMGLETTYKHFFGLFAIDLSYRFLEAEDGNGNRLENRPMHQASISFGYGNLQIAGYDIFLTIKGQADKMLDATTKAEEYLLVDLKGNYKVSDKFFLKAGITNLTNYINEDNTIKPGREIYFGVDYIF
jgi:outer membrane receptor for ferrienterochelin and colicins